MDIAEKIKEIRMSTNMSQKEFGKIFGIPWRTISNWESGRSVPPEYIIALLEYAVENEGRPKRGFRCFYNDFKKKLKKENKKVDIEEKE